ncbi:MAG: hypothetical protein L0Z62_27995 [Gemmataceae bacterium]|nr:hypothetical protein [Gemmataceae bacterium]
MARPSLLLAVVLGLAACWGWPVHAGEKPAAKDPGDKKDMKDPAQKAEPLSPERLKALWEDLAGKDAAKAYKAIWAMVDDPKQSVPFLKERLKAVPTPDAKRLQKLVGDLDHPRFPEREKAMVELEKLGALARPALEGVLAAKPSLEVRRRVEKLLEKITGFTLSPEELRVWRALEVLEHVGNPAARQVLQTLAEGAPGSWQSEEARAALERLKRRTAAP